MMVFSFDWDHGNLHKNEAKHGVKKKEVEEVFWNKPVYEQSKNQHADEQRLVAYGVTNEERFLTIVFTFRVKLFQIKIRAISARAMHKKERQFYEKAISKI